MVNPILSQSSQPAAEERPEAAAAGQSQGSGRWRGMSDKQIIPICVLIIARHFFPTANDVTLYNSSHNPLTGRQCGAGRVQATNSN